MGEVESKKGGVGKRASAPQLTVTVVVIKSSMSVVTLGHWETGL